MARVDAVLKQKGETMAKATPATVYLVVHEIFGIFFHNSRITLVTPHIPPTKTMPGHTYKIARFEDGWWSKPDVLMNHNSIYTLKGVVHRYAAATDIPCHPSYSPHPKGKFKLKKGGHAYCRWELPLPKKIHQLRLVSIPDGNRPLFEGDPHGDAVDAELSAISLVHAFEYEQDGSKQIGIYEGSQIVKGISYATDSQNSINVHIWAQVEDETKMDDNMANQHAGMATQHLVNLFTPRIAMTGGKLSLSVDNAHPNQPSIPRELKYVELITLAEKFTLSTPKPTGRIDCTHKTCGQGGTLYVTG
jgi:hypothetical protein